MPRHPYFIGKDLLGHALTFVSIERWLFESLPVGPYPYFRPLYEIERDLALHGYWVNRLATACRERVAEMAVPVFPIPVRRVLSKVPELIVGRLQGWGWDGALAPDGQEWIAERLRIHDERTYVPLLDAALSWRLGDNVKENHYADDRAVEAERRGIEPTLTPEEGERVFDDRHRDWYMTPALAAVAPTVTSEEHNRLDSIVDDLRRELLYLLPPDAMTGLAGQLERSMGPVSHAPPEIAHRPSMAEGDPERKATALVAETRPTETGSPAPKASGLDDLTPTAWKLLRAIRDMKARDAETAVSREEIAERADTGNANSMNIRNAYRAMKALGLIVTRQNVGTWLTDAGLNALKSRR